MKKSRISRKDFLKKAGLLLASGPFMLRALLDTSTAQPLAQNSKFGGNCVLLPFQTGGPFYLDPQFNRADIRETLTGLPMNIKIKVIGVQNCEPVPNAVVNIWHCDTLGGYSQFGAIAGNYDDFSNATWLRGYQITNAEGECNFISIFPGWYGGRAAHIHFDVHLGFVSGGTVNQQVDPSSTLMSQMYFPDSDVSEIYTTIAPYNDRGDNPTNTTNDFIFQDAGSLGDDLVMTLDKSDMPNSLSAEFCIGIDTAGTPTSLDDAQGAKFFELKTNSPNPFMNKTAIDFTLHEAGTITLSIFSLDGEMVAQLAHRQLQAGEYSVEFDRNTLGLPAGNYLVDLVLHKNYSRYRQSKQMTIL